MIYWLIEARSLYSILYVDRNWRKGLSIQCMTQVRDDTTLWPLYFKLFYLANANTCDQLSKIFINIVTQYSVTWYQRLWHILMILTDQGQVCSLIGQHWQHRCSQTRYTTPPTIGTNKLQVLVASFLSFTVNPARSKTISWSWKLWT